MSDDRHRHTPTREQLRIWRNYIETAEVLRTRLASRMQSESALSSGDYQVLLALSEADQHTVRSSELADLIGWERSRLSHHLGRMERRDLIQRRECPEDGRGAVVALLPLGRQGIQEAAPGHARFVRTLLFGGLGPDGLRALDTLTRIIARDKGDKGLEAAENNLREQIEQMAEPVDAGLNAEESSELRDLDRWLQERKTGLLQGADRRVWASEPLPELHAEIEREQRRAGELSERIRDMRDQYDTARSRAEHVADDYRDRLRELSDKCGAALDAETARLERDMADDWRDVHRLLERHHEDETERLRLTDRNEPGYRSFVMGRRRLAGEATERANQSLMRYQAARAEFEDRWHIGYGEYRSNHELRIASARAKAEETPAVTDLRDRMRDLEHEREHDPEISAPERLRARVQELGNEYEEVLRTNADRRSMADIRQAETLGDRARLAALRDMRRPDAIDEYNSVLGRLEEGWGRGFWNELTGFREEHPNWGGWAMPVLRNDQFNYNGEFEPYFKEPEDIRYRDDAVLGTLVETAAYQRLDRDQLRTMTPRQIDQATRKLRKSLEVREHDRTAIDQAWQDAPRGEQITNDLAELERALGHRPGWVDYTAMLRERETEYLLGYDSHPSISYDADPFQATPTWSAGAGHGAGYGARI